MTREIRFRGWDRDFNKMRVVFFSRGFDNELIIMQFTGLKDKKEKEIFEGDIVLIKTWMNFIIDIKEVSFEKGCFMIGDDLLKDFTDVEVIGNIFENKELLVDKVNNRKEYDRIVREIIINNGSKNKFQKFICGLHRSKK